MRYIINFTTLALIILGLFSCSRDDSSSADKADIRVNVALREATANSGLSGTDPKINSIRIMVFDANGFIDVNKLFSWTGEAPQSTFNVNTRVGKDKRVVVVANEGELKDQMENVISLKQFEEIKQSTLPNNQFETRLSVVSTPFEVKANTQNTCSVSLIRAYAKININIVNKTNDHVVIKSIKLLHMAKTSYLKDSELKNTSDNLYDIPKSFNSQEASGLEISKDAEHPTTLLDNFLVYEQIPDNKDQSPLLQVIAEYNGIPVVYEKKIGLPVVETDAEKTCIKRNHAYTISASITGISNGQFEGMFINTQIVNWNTEEINQNLALPYIESITDMQGQPLSFNNIYEVRYNEPFKFKLKIHSGILAKWFIDVSDIRFFSVTPDTGSVNTDNSTVVTVSTIIPKLYKPIEFRLYFKLGKFAVSQSNSNTQPAVLKLIQHP